MKNNNINNSDCMGELSVEEKLFFFRGVKNERYLHFYIIQVIIRQEQELFIAIHLAKSKMLHILLLPVQQEKLHHTVCLY